MFEHKKCKHTWAVISEPCGPGMGFVTCDIFYAANGRTIDEKPRPGICRTMTRPCPRCEGRNLASNPPGSGGGGGVAALTRYQYDVNTVRMVEKRGWGLKWGTGPAMEDWGLEMRFGSGNWCVIM
ncbi:hypothetical protein GMORB2_6182 [Geosmithia morbida]|uniref:Uncharacterized protein n=1 Tax=Geosmithia morbida TaxID=1094350 RepID=A0A9P5D4F4_9HYPO|nr:uncharacterized protein GMORB2_6182 [Geosmithia morbida]KAF4123481.1 hypothetical protein GMORB2_6182 [Geosmithia morbida]